MNRARNGIAGAVLTCSTGHAAVEGTLSLARLLPADTVPDTRTRTASSAACAAVANMVAELKVFPRLSIYLSEL